MRAVPGPDAAPTGPNIHAAWRLEVARRAAAAYTRNPKLAALTVAGSVGAGLADRKAQPKSRPESSLVLFGQKG
jgi:hypothetical protein